ncbi:MAG: bifunctional salicylyl-CoA 5-hydroxylase/oxidoreductase [Rhizobiaceae bacterium]
MKITVIGGGPGGLYFSLLTKKARPDWDIEVYEQNKADDTFGFGVVFSDDTLDEFLNRDLETYEMIRDSFAYWQDIAIHFKGDEIRCGGNGFCGTSRQTLLTVLQTRAEQLGVKLNFEVLVKPEDIKTRFADSDIILVSDGIGSQIRDANKDIFQPTTVLKTNRFCWMGSTRPMDEFNYFFKETEHGIICAHTYQYEPGHSTWVFEMDNDCWLAHGFTEFDEEGSKVKLLEIFKDELQGHDLLLNRSMWRQFPRIFCESWYGDNMVILGDAKASAHFSIGSGSKLAMDCGIALSDAVLEHAEASVEAAFKAYDDERRTPCQIIQHNADVSLSWFEHMDRSWDMDPMQFAMVVMCRAKSVTYENLMLRDEEFVHKADTEYYERHYKETGEDVRKSRPTPMFTSFTLRDMKLSNRVVMSPMAQYRADKNGDLTDWHKVHYGSHALGGMGLIFTEMTCPSMDARITPGCPGIWNDKQEKQWAEVVDFIHTNSVAKICMQLGHAGRKGSTNVGWKGMDEPLKKAADNWPLYSASAISWNEGINAVPKEVCRVKMDEVRDEFVAATIRAADADFDMIELHCAHGYFLASFLSPLTNVRSDEYGGSIENRIRYPLEVFTAMREAWPKERPMSVRVSASDWKAGGLTEADLIAIAEAFAEAGCDLIDVSSGQTVADQTPIYGRMYQANFAETVRNVPKIATMAVGAITEASQVNTILHTRRADLVALGRPHLWNPYFTHQAAAWYGVRNAGAWSPSYMAGAIQANREQEKTREKLTELQKKASPSGHEKAQT